MTALASVLRDRVHIQVKTATRTALGQTEVWTPVQTLFARIIPLDAKARLAYMQLKSEITHKVVLRGNVSLDIGKNRILHGSKTYEPVEPPQVVDDTTVVMVKEV